MAAGRSLGIVVLILGLVPVARAQTYPLTETPKVDDYFRIHIEMNLSGEMRVTRRDTQVPLKLTATATHDFPERILMVSSTGLPQKSARFYETAKAVISVDGSRAERSLRPDRRLMVTIRDKDQGLAYCPDGTLTREELDLTEHFDTLNLTGLLPGKAVAIGETWKLANPVAQALCNFEGLTAQNLAAKLEEVKNNVARFSITGTASGINLGALAKLTISGTGYFDLGQNRLTKVEWKQKDERDQGPASPATAVEVNITLTRAAMEEPKCLDDVALVSVPDGLAPGDPSELQLYFREPNDAFELSYAREWQMQGITGDHLIMRLIDRGDWIAQVVITPWTKAKPGEHMTAEAFQEAMAETPGWEPDQVLQAGEVPMEGGRWCYRISALGDMDEMKVMQNFYIVASPQGEQIVLAFTMKQAQADKLGTRDLSLVGSLEFPSSRKNADKPKQP